MPGFLPAGRPGRAPVGLPEPNFWQSGRQARTHAGRQARRQGGRLEHRKSLPGWILKIIRKYSKIVRKYFKKVRKY